MPTLKMDSKYAVLPFLPETRLKRFAPGLTILQPLSRRGVGPGLILLVSDTGAAGSSALAIENGVPSPLMKWAEEGYTVVEITKTALARPDDAIRWALEELRSCKTVDIRDVVGLIGKSQTATILEPLVLQLFPEIIGASVYSNLHHGQSMLAPASIPQIHHLAGKASTLLQRAKDLTVYDYPSVKSLLFATPFQEEFSYASESISHTRNLSFLKQLMKGPYFDLEAIWDEHTYYEFDNRSVECTMGTMVQEPYVNHIPTMTGGIGRERLTAFYRDHFIFQNPADTSNELISHSVGIDRVIDEFIFKCTHETRIDWLLPGLGPTGRKLEIPFTAVVNIRGDRLYHEHIIWDQGTVLAQLGLMPEYLPYHYPHPDATKEKPTRQPLEYRVPVAGLETAAKMRDKDAVGSNQMILFKVREVSG
ncbi:Carboxymethylenebutenolidase [Fusarium sp. Ph1]|nr:Carboxymethylenebutenolidase [Fusarium sp. Ph1]